MRIYDTIEKMEPINKGFSGDKKYCVETADETKYLLRIMPAEKLETWQNLFKMLERLISLGVPMCKPIELGTCDDGVYVIQSWIDGEDLNDILPKLSEAEQYALGIKAGEILRVINSIPAPKNEENWAVKCNRKIDEQIKQYREHDMNKLEGGEHFIDYIEKNREPLKCLLENRPQSFMHGAYCVPNMMLEDGKLRIIDIDRYKFGDPWSEFFKTIFSARISPHFTTGQLRGYFSGEPPMEFFKLLTFYTSYPFLAAISWAVPHGQEEVDFVRKLCADTLKWFDNMNNPVPSWYLKDFHVQWIGYLKEKILQTKEIRPIGRTLCLDGAVCHVMGLTLQTDRVMQLLVLEYDEDYREKMRQAEFENMYDEGLDKPVTNRNNQNGSRDLSPHRQCGGVKSVFFGEREFAVVSSGSSICSPQHNWDVSALFVRFLLSGWDSSGIDDYDTDYMYMSSITFDGVFDSIPNFEPSAPIRFSMQPTHHSILVEQPVTLTVGSDYKEKLYFTDKDTGEIRWVQINRVYLYDMWSEMEKAYADPRMKAFADENELARQKSEYEKMFENICPKGMCYLGIDYESEDETSCEFFSKSWLDAEIPVYNGGSAAYATAIMVSPQQSVGKLGLRLQSALIQEPFSPDTSVIEAELFRCHTLLEKDDIIM